MKKNAYAKINLVLEILGKRKDGYHEISSIFQEISLHDSIEIEESDTLKIIFNPAISTNLSTVHKTVEQFQEKTHIKVNLQIKIHKNIPETSGLGGGSSDAATTLLLLNEFYKKPLKKEQLLEIAKNIGADVPFFLTGHRALVKGIGEKISSLPNTKLFGVLVFPDFGYSTEASYALVDRISQWDKGNYTDAFIDAIKNKKDITKYFYNRFEIVYSILMPGFNKFIEKIQKLSGEKFHLTGSGSAMFYLTNNKIKSKTIFEKLLENKINVKQIETR